MKSQSHIPALNSSLIEKWKLVEPRIRQDFAQRVHNFHINVLDEGLVLEGRTKTYYGKQKVQHAVMSATDLPILANNIVVG